MLANWKSLLLFKEGYRGNLILVSISRTLQCSILKTWLLFKGYRSLSVETGIKANTLLENNKTSASLNPVNIYS